jgi:hypothetical protein
MGRLFVGVLSPELPSEYTQKMVWNFTHKSLSQTSLILSKMIHYTEVVEIMYNTDPVQIN